MIVEGKQLAADIRAEIQESVARLGVSPRLTIFSCDPNFETRKYLGLKERIAKEVGITTDVQVLPKETTTEELRARIKDIDAEGIIVQLPLPSHIDTEEILSHIPATHDVDALNERTTAVRPPVAEAAREILMRHNVSVEGTNAVVVGEGRLVGKPAAALLREMGAVVTVLTHESTNREAVLRRADIIVSGAGDPGYITPNMIKEGVVLIDAGTSEDGGILVGDADPACAEKASLFTPVPGGIGPITVAVLLRNLVILMEECTGKRGVV